MNVTAVEALRARIAAATGQEFISYNDPALVSLVPHAEIPGSETLPLMTGALVVRRGSEGKIIKTGLVEAGPQPDRPLLEAIGVTRLGLIDPDQKGNRSLWKTKDVSTPSPDELLVLLISTS